MWLQKTLVIKARQRGFHLITDELLAQLPELSIIDTGLAHLMLLHTSASLSINENADPTVRMDLDAHLNNLAPEGQPYYRHILEGADDMPAHIKAALLGVELTVPISRGRLQLGSWQGVYLGEHRDDGGERSIIVTLNRMSMQG